MDKFFKRLEVEECNIQYGFAESHIVNAPVGQKIDISEHEGWKDVYFVAGVRKDKNGRCKDVDILARKHIAFDFDDLKYEDYDKLKEALDNSVNFTDYSYILFTGGGFHVYYIGEEIFIGKDKKDWYKRALQDLHNMIDVETGFPSDHQCVNASRLMRVPTSFSRKRLVDTEIMIEVDVESELLQLVTTLGHNIPEKKESKIKVEGGDTFAVIDNIPVEDVCLKVMDMNLQFLPEDNNHFINVDTGKKVAFFKSEDKNAIMHGGTDHLPDHITGYSPFVLVRERLKLDDSGVFKWFSDNYGVSDSLGGKLEDMPDEDVAPLACFEKKEARKGRYLMAERLKKDYIIKSLDNGGHEKEIYCYDDGIYIGCRNVLKKDIKDELKSFCTKNVVSEVLHAVEIDTFFDKKAFDEINPDVVNVKNGLLNIKTGELSDHTPDFYSFNKLPVIFDQDADCPKIKKFMGEILNEADIPVIQEWFGFCLCRELFLKKAILMPGPKDTGKSTLLNLLHAFIGDANTSIRSLQSLSNDKFSMVSLYQKLLNIYDDLDADDIKKNGQFKGLTGRSPMTGEEKFKGAFSFVSYAKLTFSCNKIPLVKDIDDPAYFERWLIVDVNKTIKKENRDPDLLKKMTTDEEMSGLLNWSIEGLKRLFVNNQFSIEMSDVEVKLKMLRGEPVAAFIDDCLVKGDHNSIITKDEMTEYYNSYALKYELPQKDKKKIGEELQKFAHWIVDSRETAGESDAKRRYCWRNVALSELGEDIVRKLKYNDEVSTFK